jgi:SsrA-binding protein
MDFIRNRKVKRDFKVLESYSAGVELFGFEVKSIKGGKGSLDGSHITIRGNEAFLIGATIPPYQSNNTPKNYDPSRNRRLLLNKKEISELAGYEKQKGLTIVPISMYNKVRKIKVDIAVVQGKKKFDKREDIKRKDTRRDVEINFKARMR